MKHRLQIVCLAIMVAVAGCSSSDGSAKPRDASAIQLDGGMCNSSTTVCAEVAVRVERPMHLTSDLSVDAAIELYANVSFNLTHQEAFQRLKDATELVDRATRTPVAGTWAYKDNSYKPTIQATFTPTTPLAKGDYLLKVKEDGKKIAARRTVTMFHVGPLPWVKEIRFRYSKKVQGKPLEFDIIDVFFSEKVDYSVVDATFENEIGGTWTKLSTTRQDIGWRLPAPLDVKLKLRVTVGQDVGAVSGLKLDGLYTGKPGSGDFAATFVPATYANQSSPEAFVPEVVY